MTLEQFLELVSKGHPRGWDNDALWIDTTSWGYPGKHCIWLTLDQIEALDPRMPEVLDTLAGYKLASHRRASAIVSTLKLWHGRLTYVGDVTTEESQHKLYIEQIRQAETGKDQNVVLYLDICEVEALNAYVDYARRTVHWTRHTFSKDDLEALFPGSVARLKQGQQMGLDPEQLAAVIITPTVSPVEGLPDLCIGH